MLSGERCRSNMLPLSPKQPGESTRNLRNPAVGEPLHRRSKHPLRPPRTRPLEQHQKLRPTTTSHCPDTSPDPPRTMQHLPEHTLLPPRGFRLRGRRRAPPWRPSTLDVFPLEAPMANQWLLLSQRPTPKAASHSQRVANSLSRRTQRRRPLPPSVAPVPSNSPTHTTRLPDKSHPRDTSARTPSPALAKSCLDVLVQSWVVAVRNRMPPPAGIVRTSGTLLPA